MAGARADSRHLSSNATPERALAADDRRWSAGSGDVGIVVWPMQVPSPIATYGTGWRAPTLFDLCTNGPNLGDARYEIGDRTLKTERAMNGDAGIRWSSDRIRGEAFVFRNMVGDFISTTPTSVKQGGLQVFRHVQGDARLTGGEVAVEARVADPLMIRVSHDRVTRTDLRLNVPLPLMPPARSTVGAQPRLHALGTRTRGDDWRGGAGGGPAGPVESAGLCDGRAHCVESRLCHGGRVARTASAL